MARKRPCSVCRRWFEPERRAGGRQRVCSAASCQAERHRRACERWREQHPEYDRERRLRERVRRDSGPGEPLARDPLTEVAWEAARDAVGLEVAVIVEETAKVLAAWARDAVHAQSMEIMKRLAKVVPAPARDAMVAGTGPP